MAFNLNDILAETQETAIFEETNEVGTEAISKEVEREFCMWAELSYEEQSRLVTEHGGYIYIDFLLKSIEGQRRRVRINASDGTAQLTTKVLNTDGSRTEENTDLSLQSALHFFMDAKTTHVCYRVKYDAELEHTKGWDVDLFVRNVGHTTDIFTTVDKFNAFIEDIKASAVFLPLTKIELEVEKDFSESMTMDRLKELSKIDTVVSWPSTTKEPVVRAMLDNFWDHESDF